MRALVGDILGETTCPMEICQQRVVLGKFFWIHSPLINLCIIMYNDV